MKFINAFLLFLGLTTSRSLRRKTKQTIFEIDTEKHLQDGGFGSAFSAKIEFTDIEHFAVKFLKKEFEDNLSLNEEIEIMKKLNSLRQIPNLPVFNLKDVGQQRGVPKSSTTVEDYCKFLTAIREAKRSPFARKLNSDDGSIVMFRYDCDLFDFIKDNAQNNLYPKVARLIQLKIVKAFSFLHKNKIMHRDIKAENIMIKIKEDKVSSCKPADLNEMLNGNFTVAVIDFGQSKEIKDNEKLKGRAGTFFTMAPEVFDEKEYDLKADVYSLGVVLLDIETKGISLFTSIEDFNQNRFQIVKATQNLKDSKYKNLIKSMLSETPLERPDLSKMETLLEVEQNLLQTCNFNPNRQYTE